MCLEASSCWGWCDLLDQRLVNIHDPQTLFGMRHSISFLIRSNYSSKYQHLFSRFILKVTSVVSIFPVAGGWWQLWNILILMTDEIFLILSAIIFVCPPEFPAERESVPRLSHTGRSLLSGPPRLTSSLINNGQSVLTGGEYPPGPAWHTASTRQAERDYNYSNL